ncbi:Superfamily II DNA or RNA helicase, SNF2 family [Bacillus sp. 5mfcol3.1]|uniref:SNF2-related protein n=1 Tax=Bacillus sp. 5mfcol3.1 TaxID=1761756 RepID=UPI0008EBEADB|nr:SNF2-related protein [Bacillus sp. 5mfcol3.1]SFK37175.1 Superfamily II DNA or RNA helicase, SNF2 family [Bacillus sp. 5mfcol3.1]
MFKTLYLKPSYYTDESNIADEFYNPVLKNAIRYDRVSGYFSAKALAAYGKGLQGLVRNHGEFRLVISHEISEEDFLLIKRGYENKKKLQRVLLDRMDENLSLVEEMQLFNLANLISSGYVEVRIAFKKCGLFHAKYGLCYDSYGNVIYFTGSNNETQAAIMANYESFDVSASWLVSDFDRSKIEYAQEKFEKIWNNEVKDIYVAEVDDVVKKRILSFDRGRLVLDVESLKKDVLVLTIENEKLVLYNQLESNQVNPKDYLLSKKLKYYLNQEYPNFRDDLTYIDMQKVIQILEKYAEKKAFNFVVSERLQTYIANHNFRIEDRAKYALMIKTKDPLIKSDFEKFKHVLGQEMHRSLREQQLWSAFYMMQMKKCANFSVPGSGKTSMIYGAYAFLNAFEINKVDKIVMVGPKNSFLSWKLEFYENFGDMKELKVLDIHEEHEAETQLRLNSADKNLILINYESLGKYEEVLMDIINEKTILVFDEVHKIKGISSVRAKIAKRISKKPIYKYVLTGTPIPNSYEDIYNFLNVLYQEEYKLFFNFDLLSLKKPTPIEMDKINEKLFPFFWRTTKKQLSVPEVNDDKLVRCEANMDEQKIIDLLYRKYGDKIFLLYIRLIQAASNPSLLLKSIENSELFDVENEEAWQMIEPDKIMFSEEEKALIRSVSSTLKYRKAIEIAVQLYEKDKQSIIWCMFVDTINKVMNDLSNRGIKAQVIYGATPQQERDAIIKLFKEKKIDVLITNPHTLAESVSLHKTCHDAIYLEYSFNLTHMLQSRDRIHRLGLPDGQYTQYYYLMLEGQQDRRNPIDEKVYWRLKEKQRIMEDAIEGNTLESVTFDDAEDIKNLFSI